MSATPPPPHDDDDDHDAPSYEEIAVPANANEVPSDKISIAQRMTGGMWLSPTVRYGFIAAVGGAAAFVFFGVFHSSPAPSAAAPLKPTAAYSASSPGADAGGPGALVIPTHDPNAVLPPVAAQTRGDAAANDGVSQALADAANGAGPSSHATLAPPSSMKNATPAATDAPASSSNGNASVPNPGNVALTVPTPVPAALAARIAAAQEARAGNDDVFVGDSNVGQKTTLASATGPVTVAQAALPVSSPTPAAQSVGDGGKPAYLQTRHERPLGQFEIWAGTTIPVQLDTAINTSSGTSVVVAHTTEDIYDSKTGQTLVIPKFSRLIGHAEGAKVGQNRVSCGWDRLIWTDGSYQNLDNQEGADREGNNGLFADVKQPNILAASILTGIIAGGAQLLGSSNGSSGTTVQVNAGSAIGGNVGSSLANAGAQIIAQKANQPPELTVPRGQRFSVVLDRTMLLEPWAYDDSAETDPH